MKIKNDKKYYNEKNGKVYINGKRRSTTVFTPTTHAFEDAKKEIDKTFNKYGVLSKCDRILGLFKRGYDLHKCCNAIAEYLSGVKDKGARITIARIYAERMKGC